MKIDHVTICWPIFHIAGSHINLREDELLMSTYPRVRLVLSRISYPMSIFIKGDCASLWSNQYQWWRRRIIISLRVGLDIIGDTCLYDTSLLFLSSLHVKKAGRCPSLIWRRSIANDNSTLWNNASSFHRRTRGIQYAMTQNFGPLWHVSTTHLPTFYKHLSTP